MHTEAKFACVTKCMHSRVDSKLPVNQGFQRYLLLLTNLSFKFRFTVAFLVLMLGFQFTLWQNLCASLLYFVLHV